MMRMKLMTVLLALTIGGCGFAPGMYLMPMSDTSDVEVPVTENGEPATAKARITRITADVVVAQAEQGRQLTASIEKPPQTPYQRYRLGPRDILTIVVWDHPELTIPAGEFRSAEQAGTVIGEDGNIFYPYVGVVKAAGLTVEQLRDVITRKIATYIENPQIDIRVAAWRSQRVYIVGEVKAPGIQPITDIPMTIAEAINRAGGVTDLADESMLTLSRGGKTYRIDLQGLYESGDAQQNVLLQAGDVLNVWDTSLNKVFVLGEVGQQRALLINKGRLTLAEALGESGGLDRISANAGRVYVIRSGQQKDVKPEIFHLDASSADAMLLADRFPLRARDVVYVDTAGVTRWNRVISQILPTAQTLSASTVAHFPLFKGTQTTTTQIRGE